MPYHLHRLYLSGDNTFSGSLALSTPPDPEVAGLVVTEEFSKFAAECAKEAQWAAWEQTVYYFLCLVYYPVAPLFLQSTDTTHINLISAS
jgi:hypothetical protein